MKQQWEHGSYERSVGAPLNSAEEEENSAAADTHAHLKGDHGINTELEDVHSIRAAHDEDHHSDLAPHSHLFHDRRRR